MEKLYTKVNDIYVLQNPGDLSALGLKGCVLARKDGMLYVRPLESLKGKEVEDSSKCWADPVFGFYGDEIKPPKSIILKGREGAAKFCNLCKDRLNGITANCFDRTIKSAGCAFIPVNEPENFEIALQGWQKLNPALVNTRTPFKKPASVEDVRIDRRTICFNEKVRKIKSNFKAELEAKKKEECFRCIHNGLCRIDSLKIAERCMQTEEETMQSCLQKINRIFGSVDEFLKRTLYSGQEISFRPRKDTRKTKWLVFMPSGRNHYILRKAWRPWKMVRISAGSVWKKAEPGHNPSENREKIAALGWFFLEKYCSRKREAYWGYRGRKIRILSVRPVSDGIEAAYYPYGWRPHRRVQTFRSFNDILRLER